MEIKDYSSSDYIVCKVVEGDTKDSLSQRFKIGFDKISVYNKCGDLYAGEYLIIPQKLKLHYVKPLESLTSIANIYNLSSDELSQKNGGIKDVYIGQPLFI